MVCISKTIANCSKSPQFLPVMCAPLWTLCPHPPKDHPEQLLPISASKGI